MRAWPISTSSAAFRIAAIAVVAALAGALPAAASVTPAVSINDVNAYEHAGNVGFTMTLSEPSDQLVSVDVTWTSGSAIIGNDFTATNQTITFAAGETVQYPMFQLLEDATSEPTETFSIDISNPINAVVGDGHGVGTILDNDAGPGPSISIADGATGENATTLQMVMTLSQASNVPITVDVATENGTATAGTDYVSVSGYVYFAPGVTSRNLLFQVLNDSVDEPDETFKLNLSNPSNASIADHQGIGTIRDDDEAAMLSIGDVTVDEAAGTATALVSLSRSTDQPATATFNTVAGSATSAADYAGASGSITFSSGTTSQSVSVDILEDDLDEPDELFTILLSAPSNAALGDAEAQVTIVDNDGSDVVAHGRSFASLRLRRHAVTGKVTVDDGFSPCSSHVRVKLMRRTNQNWVTVKSSTTDDEGSFRLKFNHRSDRFRVVAPAFTAPDSTYRCEAARRSL